MKPRPTARGGRHRRTAPSLLERPLAPRLGLGACLAVLLLASACAVPASTAEPTAERPLAGTWRAVLGSPGGELPFTLRVEPGPDGALAAWAVTAGEREPISRVERDGDRVHLLFEVYDSRIDATLSADGSELTGRWIKTVPEGTSELPFRAVRGDRRRFLPPGDAAPGGAAAAAVPSVEGRWEVVFRDADGSEPAVAELEQDDAGSSRVTGTFLTPTGDYRFLEGDYRDGLLRLSTFDGGHAFLFRAEARPDGTLEGDFWSRDSYHATWTAEPTGRAAGEILPDPWGLAALTNDERRFRFAFPDLEGRLVSSEDPRFDGKVVVVDVFGSWCPNCNDEAPVLARWHRQWADDGLEIVGLAFEFTGDAERDRRQLRRFAERHGIGYPLLLAGTSDKADAAAELPDLDRVVAYPTTIFIGRDATVRRIHSGFAGPGTGEHHERLVEELEALVGRLLAEPVPGGGA